MNTGLCLAFVSPCSWLPGSRAKLAPRNDTRAMSCFHPSWRTPSTCWGSHPDPLPASRARASRCRIPSPRPSGEREGPAPTAGKG